MSRKEDVYEEPQNKEENIRFSVTILTDKNRQTIDDVLGYTLENDIYFFSKRNVFCEDHPSIQTVWLKNPKILGVSIRPYFEDEEVHYEGD